MVRHRRATTFNRLGVLVGLSLGLGWAASAGAVKILSADLTNPQPCPGETLTLMLTLANTTSGGSADGRVLARLEPTSAYPTCAFPTNVVDPAAWWLLYAGASPSNLAPQTDPVNAGGYYPGGGGFKMNPGGAWNTLTQAFTFTVPAAAVAGATYDLNLYADDYPIGSVSSSGSSLCVPLTLNCQPPAPTLSAQQTVSGSLAPGAQELIRFDYSAFNATNNSLVSTLAPCLNILSASPQPYNGAAPSIVGQSISWKLPDAAPYTPPGELWVLVQATAACGANVSLSSASLNGGGASVALNALNQVNGGASVSLTLQAFDALGAAISGPMANGASVSYVLSYSANATAGLACFDAFDAEPLGVYGAAGAGPAFGAWSFDADTTAGNTWAVAADGLGGRVLTFGPTIANSYQDLLYSCPAAAANGEDLCGNMLVQVDLRRESTTDPNSDAALVLRSDGGAFARGYRLLLSGDTNPGPGTGHLVLQRNNGSSGSGCCIWPVDSNDAAAGAPMMQEWYTVKAMEATPGHILAKYWLRGMPEPAGWSINWTDPTPLPCGSAGDGTVWRAGVGGMDVPESYDNFLILGSGAGLQVWDTVPAGLDFTSASPAPSLTPLCCGITEGLVAWSLPAFTSGSGAFTWAATANCAQAGSAVNAASVSLAGGAPVSVSATVSFQCAGSPTVTPSPSPTASAGPSVTVTPTPTRTASLSPAQTSTASPTQSAGASPSRTATASPTMAVTASPTCTATPSPTPTSGAAVTATVSATPNGGALPTLAPILVPAPGKTLLYPSPVLGSSATLALNLGQAAQVKVLIVDARGRGVLTVNVSLAAGVGLVSLDLSSLRRGVYFYKVLLTLADGTHQALPTRRFGVLR